VTASIPPWLADLGAGSGALAATIGLVVIVAGLIGRAFRRGARALREVIHAEVPAAMAAAAPAVTRDLVRKEVADAIEPHAAELRGELRSLAAQMQPNGGESLRDQIDKVNRRVSSLEAGQRKIFAHLSPGHDLDDDTDGET